jgi:hypothetical protein
MVHVDPILKAKLKMDPERKAIDAKKLSDRFSMLRYVVNKKTLLTLRDEG